MRLVLRKDSFKSTQKNLVNSNILLTFALERIRDMERMTYTNENVERFDIRGTIMSVATNKVVNTFLHRLYIKGSCGSHFITIWSTAKGYDRKLLKRGNSVRFKGIVHRHHYFGADGTDKVLLNYYASEISKN